MVRTLSTGEAEEAEVLKFLLALQRQVAVHYSARAVVVEEALETYPQLVVSAEHGVRIPTEAVVLRVHLVRLAAMVMTICLVLVSVLVALGETLAAMAQQEEFLAVGEVLPVAMTKGMGVQEGKAKSVCGLTR